MVVIILSLLVYWYSTLLVYDHDQQHSEIHVQYSRSAAAAAAATTTTAATVTVTTPVASWSDRHEEHWIATSSEFSPISLDSSVDGVNNWTVSVVTHKKDSSSHNDTTTTTPKLLLTIPATVPGDFITDLQRSNIISDPYYELTWLHHRNASLWKRDEYQWTYEMIKTVPVPDRVSNQSSSTWLFVLEGVQMGAYIRVNSHDIGVVKNQFLRYTFEIPPVGHHHFVVVPGNEDNRVITYHIQVIFDNHIDEEGRFMACTGGWDWAPYSHTTTPRGVPKFSFGIWKSLYLLEVLVPNNKNINMDDNEDDISSSTAATVLITHMTPHTHYLGPYPTTPLVEHEHGGFLVNITVHLWTPVATYGRLMVQGLWGGKNNNTTTVNSTDAMVLLPVGHTVLSLQLTASAMNIRLWWPVVTTGQEERKQQQHHHHHEQQQQPLYAVTATWIAVSRRDDDTRVGLTTAARRQIGFRVVALVTTNESATEITTTNSGDREVNKSTTPPNEGSGTHGMFFRVNGAAIYSRGANVVPMEELEGRMTDRAHRILVQSAVDANMNTLRVWGGGIFLPQSFYNACDELGVLIYHDMQYASGSGGPHGPDPTSVDQDAEIRHQIRRLSHHPSIVLWDGVNEVVVGPDDPSKVFASFVMTVVAQEDNSRAIWPSSPAAGWVTGVDTLYGRPNGRSLTTHGGGHIWDQGIETHAPYQLGSGWPVINGGDDDECWDRWQLVHIPPRFDRHTKMGVHERNVYASEFGVTGSPSFESLSATLEEHHWGLHGGEAPDHCTGECQSKRQCTTRNPMTQRNYACDAGIRLWMGTAVDLNATGEYALKAQIYLCQLVQALDQKSVIEERRGKNQFGALVWMLNDIWPSISWGSLEYGSVGFTNGQLLGGRWKPVHYFYKNSLFADVMATCGVQAHSDDEWICYVKNDRAGKGFRGRVTFTMYALMGKGTPDVYLEREVVLSPGPAAMEWFSIDMPNPNTTVVISQVTDYEDGSVTTKHLITMIMPKNLKIPRAKVSFAIANHTNTDGTIDIRVTSDRVALWVTLTSQANGRFSDNAFFLPATTTSIQFVPFYQSDEHLSVLQKTLRVEDFSMYGRNVDFDTSNGKAFAA